MLYRNQHVRSEPYSYGEIAPDRSSVRFHRLSVVATICDRTVIGYANSNTGELGISRRTVHGHEVFEVAWRDPSGKARRTKYSIDKNGEKRALQKAKKARRLGELRRVQEPIER